MKIFLQTIVVFFLFSAPVVATPVILDFSSGTYNFANNKYEEDGFIVSASRGFHSVMLNTLSWSGGDNVITLSRESGEVFDLVDLDITVRAFAGLVFESSKGAMVSVGSISGLFSFSGDQWRGIDFFTIKNSIDANILTQIDDIRLAETRVIPAPPTIVLISLMALVWGVRRNKAF